MNSRVIPRALLGIMCSISIPPPGGPSLRLSHLEIRIDATGLKNGLNFKQILKLLQIHKVQDTTPNTWLSNTASQQTTSKLMNSPE